MEKSPLCDVVNEMDAMPSSYLAAYHKGVALLEEAGISNAVNEAMWLVEGGFGITRLSVYADHDTPIQLDAWQNTLKGFRRRAAHEPIQYILGTQEFRRLSLQVAEGVFIPRPETELLVDEMVHHLGSVRVECLADIGTGSGCLAIAMATEIPGAHVFAVDRSDRALSLARNNAQQHAVQDRITFMEGHVLEPLYALRLDGRLSCIVSNPPYIPRGQIASLPKSVQDFEPLMALDGGVDGLDFYVQLLREAPGLLKSGGWLVLEMGEGQADGVCREAERQGLFRVCRVCHDDAGIARVVCLERMNNTL